MTDFPCFVKRGIGPNQLIIEVEEDLCGGVSGDERIGLVEAMDGIVKDHLGRGRVAVGDDRASAFAVAKGLVVAELQIDKRSVATIFDIARIAQPEDTPELLASVLEIEGVRAMPDDVHRIDLTEADVEGLGCLKDGRSQKWREVKRSN